MKYLNKYVCIPYVAILISFQIILVTGKVNKPHIIFILADDLGFNDVGFHGSSQIPTPNIDALAYSGLILNQYYVNPICTPSRSALMTGKYPIHTGMQHTVLYGAEPRGLPLSLKLMPEYFNELGYSSHIAGKWHLGHYKRVYTPLYRGFKTHVGCLTGHHDYFDHTAMENSWWGLDMRTNLDVAYDLHGKYSTDIITEEAVRVIGSHNTSAPLFLYVAHVAVHSGNPYNPLPVPDETIARIQNISDFRRRKFAGLQKTKLTSANRQWSYVRDHMFGLWKRRASAKQDNSRKTGTAGGKAVIFDEVDEEIIDILGEDSPVIEGLGLPEADGIASQEIQSEPLLFSSQPITQQRSGTKRKARDSLESLKNEVLESELYINKLNIFKLENELGLLQSKFTLEFQGYNAMVSKLDDSVGAIFNQLNRRNMLNDSIIIFSTDNGGPAEGFNLNCASNWPLRGVKNTLWEGGVRGAGLVWSTRFQKMGRVADQTMHIVDWLPTLMSAIGSTVDNKTDLDGISIWNELSRDEASHRKSILHNIDDIWGSASITVGEWKLHKGTNYNGIWDGWYGPAGTREESTYNFTAVYNSHVGKILSAINMMPTQQKIVRLRRAASVNCQVNKAYLTNSTSCKPLVAPCLFNIKDDPCEQFNMAQRYPNILKALLSELDKYNTTALPPGNKPADNRANPRFWDNTWTNFGDYEIESL